MTPDELNPLVGELNPVELAKLNAWLQAFGKAEKQAAIRESRTKLQLIVSRIDGVWTVSLPVNYSPGRWDRLEAGNKDSITAATRSSGGGDFKSLFG